MLEINIHEGNIDGKSVNIHISVSRKMYLDVKCSINDYSPIVMIKYDDQPNYKNHELFTYEGIKYPIDLEKLFKNEKGEINDDIIRHNIQDYLDNNNLCPISYLIGGFINIRYREGKQYLDLYSEFGRYNNIVDLLLYCYKVVEKLNQRVLNAMYTNTACKPSSMLINDDIEISLETFLKSAIIFKYKVKHECEVYLSELHSYIICTCKRYFDKYQKKINYNEDDITASKLQSIADKSNQVFKYTNYGKHAFSIELYKANIYTLENDPLFKNISNEIKECMEYIANELFK